MRDVLLFAVFPYVAVAIAAVAGAYRWAALRPSITARSSELLEERSLYWGSPAWHGAILAILAAHLAATALPGAWAALLAAPWRLYVLEVAGLGLGAVAALGIGVLVARRIRLRAVTSRMDVVVLALLVVQAATGLAVGFTLRWGSGWYLHTAAPWLRSLAALDPRIDGMAALPGLVQLHALTAFALLAVLPLSRLVHAVSLPVSYLWRPPQLVLWRRAPTEEGRP